MRTKQFRVELSAAERAELLLLVGRGSAPARTTRRAHVLLAAADDLFDGWRHVTGCTTLARLYPESA